MAVWSKIGYPKGFLPIQIYKTICFFSLPSSKLLEMSRNSCGQAIESKLEESGVPSGTAVRMTWHRSERNPLSTMVYSMSIHLIWRLFRLQQDYLRRHRRHSDCVLRGIRNALLLTVLEDDALVQELNMYLSKFRICQRTWTVPYNDPTNLIWNTDKNKTLWRTWTCLLPLFFPASRFFGTWCQTRVRVVQGFFAGACVISQGTWLKMAEPLPGILVCFANVCPTLWWWFFVLWGECDLLEQMFF